MGSEGSEGSVGSEVGLSASSAAREFERRTLRFNDTRQTVWIAFTKDDYAVAKSSLVGRVSADEAAERRARRRSTPIRWGTCRTTNVCTTR